MSAAVAAHRPGVVAILAAILLPPLGVFLARGFGSVFWISLVLTILFWIPGMIFSLAMVLRPDVMAGR